ncbi:hypothetical protein BTA51_17755 [Hahella sp. CCB-MM4]|uniref:hypothetical protein n=1 Tax=Hahella sp. (strain CCB-MM4) TaxID=1926491 RepID=UPI000B9B6ADA|nr:hypothetical protein [Hahella sp. CCB-MM4]OZG72192.1 hypothetical protein BTA51_17755 [Hahella sp. CCB-MM4]
MDRNELLNKVLAVVEKHKSLHINDPEIYQCWSEYTKLLSEDLSDTKWVLSNVGGENLYKISEAFEDISASLNSKDFIFFLKRLDLAYPEAEMTSDIDAAERAIESSARADI